MPASLEFRLDPGVLDVVEMVSTDGKFMSERSQRTSPLSLYHRRCHSFDHCSSSRDSRSGSRDLKRSTRVATTKESRPFLGPSILFPPLLIYPP